MSSKQIGEELFKEGGAKGAGKGGAADADDAARLWPMFCYDMSISVDQEEKLTQLHQSMLSSTILPSDRREASTAKSMSRSLKHGVLYQGHSAAHRNEAALLDVLTPEQSARYLQWFRANKGRCERLFGSKRGEESTTNAAGTEMRDMSLDAICQQLNDALNLRKQE